MKFTYILILSLFMITSCANRRNNDVAEKETSNVKPQNDQPPETLSDNYVGSWVDINKDPNDKTETFEITKLHDREYQIGTLTGTLKVSEQGAEYLSIWSEEYGAETQLIFDNHTSHLLMRTPFLTKELRKQ